MTWLVQYRAASGDVVTADYDTREAARDALVDQLLASALQLWQIGMSIGVKAGRSSTTYFDRGDRFIHHAARLMETAEDAYIIAGAGGRKWLLVEVQGSTSPDGRLSSGSSGTSPHPSPATQ